MASTLYQEVLAEVKPETTAFIKEYLDNVERNHALKEKRAARPQSLTSAQKMPQERDQ